MSDSTVVKELPETSMWHGAISDEDVALVRRRHAEKVEEWLDFADFVTELNALHEKYGIEKGEEGYFAYRKHLRTNYYQKLQTYGPTPDPLDEGCDCIFCKIHTEPEDCGDRCADQPVSNESLESGPHSGPYAIEENSTANEERRHPAATSNQQGTHVPRAPFVNQRSFELGPHSRPYATKKNRRVAKSNSGRLGQAPACRVGAAKWNNCRVRFADQPAKIARQKNGPHSEPYFTERRPKKLRPMFTGRIPSDDEILEQPGNWLRSG